MSEDKNRSRELEELRRQSRSSARGEDAAQIEDVRVIGDKRIAKSTIDEAEESAKSAKKKLDDLMTTLELNIGKQARETSIDKGEPKWEDAEELKRRRRLEAAQLRAEATRAAKESWQRNLKRSWPRPRVKPSKQRALQRPQKRINLRKASLLTFRPLPTL